MSEDLLSDKQVAQLLAKVPTKLYIDGQWRDSSTAATFPVENPANKQVLLNVADASVEDGAAAIQAADAAQAEWAKTSSRSRAELLRRAFERVTELADDFAALMTLEMGKPFAEARGEVTYGAEFLRWFSEQAVQNTGSYAKSPEGNLRIIALKKPVGPSLLITPWNFPLAMATRKIAPALAAGCTVIIKPAALTPLTTHYFIRVLEEVGLPKGVVNLISTTSAGKVTGPIIADRRLRKLSFTGSSEVGRTLLAQAGQNVLRTSMELGGNAPFLVFEDADLDAAVLGAQQAKLRNMGEACTAANRIYVHESVAAEFATKLAKKLSEQVVGDGLKRDTTIGPLIDQKAVNKVHELVTDAVSNGSKLVTGGIAGVTEAAQNGYFYQPTVLMDVPANARILSEEIFGPVAPIVTFKTEAEAVALANSTEFGLIAYAYTQSIARGLRLPELIESGMFGLNTGVISNAAAPFGGVKQSGIGREGSTEGIAEYQTTTYIGTPAV